MLNAYHARQQPLIDAAMDWFVQERRAFSRKADAVDIAACPYTARLMQAAEITPEVLAARAARRHASSVRPPPDCVWPVG
jgi:hypothetical protein